MLYRVENSPTQSPRKLKATESTQVPKSPGNLPDRSEFSPSPMKPTNQQNTYKFDYSSMIGKMALMSSNNMSQADINTNNGDTEKENLTEVENIRPVQVSFFFTKRKPYGEQSQIKDSEYKLRITEFDRLY